MTREEASNILDDYDVNFDGHTAGEIAEAFDVAFRALEQEPCEDAISRDMALEKMADYVASGYADSAEDFEEYSKIICQLPPVTPQSKMGRWIYKQYGGYPEQGDYHCSECDSIDNRILAYCPNCGAKMIEPQERSE